jgi:hypothetical protein
MEKPVKINGPSPYGFRHMLLIVSCFASESAGIGQKNLENGLPNSILVQAISQDNSFLAYADIGFRPNAIHLCNVPEGKCLRTLEYHKGAVVGLAFLANELISCDGTEIVFYDFTKQEVKKRIQQEERITGFSIAFDSSVMATVHGYAFSRTNFIR